MIVIPKSYIKMDILDALSCHHNIAICSFLGFSAGVRLGISICALSVRV